MSANAAGAVLVVVIGLALLAGGLYLLADEISGDLTPLAYFAMIGLGWAGIWRGIRVYKQRRPPA